MRTPLSEKDRNAFKQPDVSTLDKTTPTPTPPDPQSIAEQMLKYIPAETIAFYVPALALVVTIITLVYGTGKIEGTDFVLGLEFVIGRWILFFVALIGSLLYMYSTVKSELEKNNIDNAKQRATLKAILSAVAFIFWAITIGAPFNFIPFHETIGAILALGFTYINTLIYRYVPIPFPSLGK